MHQSGFVASQPQMISHIARNVQQKPTIALSGDDKLRERREDTASAYNSTVLGIINA